MGIMDKLKTAAQDVATEAKKATAQGKEKLEELQKRRRMDECAKELGYLVYNERVKGVTQGADTDRILSEMQHLEAALAESAPQSTYPDGEDQPGTPAPPTSASRSDDKP